MKILALSITLFLSVISGNKNNTLFTESLKAASAVKITYLERSGWLVETEKHLLLFDYVPYEGKYFADFVQQEFDNAIKNKKQLFLFLSHEHEDHFYSKLLGWSKKYSNLEIVLGWNYESSQTVIHHLSGIEVKTIKQLNVAVHPSSDAGSAFLVTIDGITIYHAGDHAQWATGLKEDFKKETEYIKGKASKIDVAFIPVESRRNQVMDGAIAATKILNPQYALPMHSKFEDYKIFSGRVKSALPSAQIYFPKANKEVFTISK